MGQLQPITASRINELHSELTGLLNKSVTLAIEIGKMLTEKKAELSHGEFAPWIRGNLDFGERTVQRYMKLYEHKDKVLKAGSVTDAYRMLAEPKTDTCVAFGESLCKLGEMLEFMKANESVTGFIRGTDERQVSHITIMLTDEDEATYELMYTLHTADEMLFKRITNKQSYPIPKVMQYLCQHPDIDLEKAVWMK